MNTINPDSIQRVLAESIAKESQNNQHALPQHSKKTVLADDMQLNTLLSVLSQMGEDSATPEALSMIKSQIESGQYEVDINETIDNLLEELLSEGVFNEFDVE